MNILDWVVETPNLHPLCALTNGRGVIGNVSGRCVVAGNCNDDKGFGGYSKQLVSNLSVIHVVEKRQVNYS